MKLISARSIGVLFLGFWLTTAVSAEAASLYIDPAFNTLHRGDSITLSVRLDVDEEAEECINAVDGVLTYPSNIEPVDVSIGDSIFNIWVEQPTINRENKTITFAGGIPNGYCGRVIGDPRLTNVLAKIVFRSPGFTIGPKNTDEDQATIEFTDESTAYLNDGKGTKAPLVTYSSTIELDSSPSSNQQNAWQDDVNADKTPPEEFSIDLKKGSGNFYDKYYIVFNTSDKQTGVDHYEVMEEPLAQFGSFQWGRADAPWVKARSPYILEDQSLNSIIRVKAIDKAGNEYLTNLIPDESMRTLSPTEIMLIMSTLGGIVLLLILGFTAVYLLKRRKRLTVGRTETSGYSADEDLPVTTDDYEKYEN